MIKETSGNVLIFFGIIFLVGIISIFFISHSPLDLFMSLLLLIFILTGLYIKGGYFSKSYYLMLFLIFILQGLILTYSYLLSGLKESNLYIYIIGFMFYVIIYVTDFFLKIRDNKFDILEKGE
jgi:hypothetical protein